MRAMLAVFFTWSLGAGLVMANTETQVYGYVEKVILMDAPVTVSAKLDTGAKSASLNAIDITDIEVKGQPYLRFVVPTKTGNYTLECPYVGRVKIKVRASETNPGHLATEPIRRPVVLLNVRLGDKTRAIRVNLTNRKRFLYPLLLGRDAIMAFNGAVNPALTFTVKSREL
jgi:hypothetical protein